MNLCPQLRFELQLPMLSLPYYNCLPVSSYPTLLFFNTYHRYLVFKLTFRLSMSSLIMVMKLISKVPAGLTSPQCVNPDCCQAIPIPYWSTSFLKNVVYAIRGLITSGPQCYSCVQRWQRNLKHNTLPCENTTTTKPDWVKTGCDLHFSCHKQYALQ